MTHCEVKRSPGGRWGRTAMVLLAALALPGAVVWWQWPQPAPPPTVVPDVLPWRAEQGAAQHDLSAPATVTAGQLLMRPGDTATEHEPADLPVPEALGASDARREAGWIRRQRGVIETMSLWQVHAPDAEGLASSYNEAARTAGFTAASSDTSPRAVTQLFHRPVRDARTAGHEVLTIRLSSTPDASTTQENRTIRILVWLRTPTLD